MLSVRVVESLKIFQTEDFLLRVLIIKLLLCLFLLLKVEPVIEVGIVWVRRNLTHQCIDMSWRWCVFSILKKLIVVRPGKIVPFRELIVWKPVQGHCISHIIHPAVVNMVINPDRYNLGFVLVILLLPPELFGR